MKTFFLAAGVFLLILVFVITSAVLSVKYAYNLKSIAEDFPSSLGEGNADFSATLDYFRENFEMRRRFLHFIIGHSENESIDSALCDLEAAQKSGDHYGYASARDRLISAIQKIIEAESLSLETIF